MADSSVKGSDRVYRKYYSYNDMPEPVKPLPMPSEPIKTECKKVEKKDTLFGFKKDDLLIAAVIIMLIANDCNDKFLLMILAGLLLFDCI